MSTPLQLGDSLVGALDPVAGCVFDAAVLSPC